MKSGFVSIIGRPNVGKSTLLNTILKKKVSIVSPKAQTTRNSIQGIYNSDDSQIIFIDNPGVHKPNSELSTFMNKSAFSSLRDVEAMLIMVDASVEFGEGDKFLLDKIKDVKIPSFIVLNKIDQSNLLLVDNLKKQYKEHYEIYLKIIDSVNTTSQLINELGRLSVTGVENIDNFYYALHKSQSKLIEIFEPIEE